MTRQVTGADSAAGFAEDQIIVDPAVLLAFERLAALRWPWR
jgi:hypothetical protein